MIPTIVSLVVVICGGILLNKFSTWLKQEEKNLQKEVRVIMARLSGDIHEIIPDQREYAAWERAIQKKPLNIVDQTILRSILKQHEDTFMDNESRLSKDEERSVKFGFHHLKFHDALPSLPCSLSHDDSQINTQSNRLTLVTSD